MNRCAFLKEKPAGGIGNRLFTYNFLFQIAHQLRFTPDLYQDDASLISSTKQRVHPKYQHLCHQYLDGSKVPTSNSEFRVILETISASGKCLRISNTLLGDTFFQSSVVHPRNFFPNLQFLSAPSERLTYRIGMHFRGTDFKTWNPKAILSPDYYLDSFEYLQKAHGNHNLELVMFTDDLELESVGVVEGKLRKLLPVQISSASAPTSDLMNLAGCNAIVSSPSTFAIWSGILSTDALIIHSKDWVEDRVKNEESFWMRVAQGGGAFYRVKAIL